MNWFNNASDNELERLRLKKMNDMIKAANQSNNGNYPDSPVKVDDQSFDRFVNQYPLVVVDCWAPWCGPCRTVGPIVDELAKDYSGKITFGKLNTDENQSTAMRFGIMGIPTLLVLKNGEEVDRIVGAMPKSTLETKLRKYV